GRSIENAPVNADLIAHRAVQNLRVTAEDAVLIREVMVYLGVIAVAIRIVAAGRSIVLHRAGRCKASGTAQIVRQIPGLVTEEFHNRGIETAFRNDVPGERGTRPGTVHELRRRPRIVNRISETAEIEVAVQLIGCRYRR